VSHITTEVGDSILSKTLFKGKTLEKRGFTRKGISRICPYQQAKPN